MMRPATILALVAASLAAAGPAPRVERVGSLELAYDPARWSVESVSLSLWRAAPVDRREGQTVEINLDYGGPCSQEAMAALAYTHPGFDGRRGSVKLASGLDLHWAEGDTGCRNAAARPFAGCVRHSGQVHLFRTPPQGCRGNPFGDDRPLTLLQGLRPR